MDDTQIALINTSYLDEETDRNFKREIDAEVTSFDATEQELPEIKSGESSTLSPFDGVVITGSSSSVYWDKPWINELIDWTATVVKADIPVLGVCFGHQVLAEAIGGTVDELGKTELGYITVEKTAQSDLFVDIDEKFPVFSARSDAVVELPEQVDILARNESGLQAFSYGACCYGIQFHPEFDLKTCSLVIESYDLSEDETQSLKETVTESNHEAAKQAKRIFDNFLDIVRNNSIK